jgi:hypothetical protein
VVLSTGIPEETCRRICLGYQDHRGFSAQSLSGREDEGILVVSHAGEVLHRLESEREEGGA